MASSTGWSRSTAWTRSNAISVRIAWYSKRWDTVPCWKSAGKRRQAASPPGWMNDFTRRSTMSNSTEGSATLDVAFLGLGTMGYPMAGHLARAGHRTTVYNRSADKAKRWAGEYGGTVQPTPRQAASGADIVFACVGNDDDLRSVTLGDDGAFAGMKKGALFVDHTTTSAEVARELAAVAAERGLGYVDAPASGGQAGAVNAALTVMMRGAPSVDHTAASAEVARELAAVAAERGLGFVDAPVSGGQAGAVNGALTVMCGGDPATCEKIRPVASAFGRAVTLIGPTGSGQLAKMVNQICIAGLVQGLSEAIAFGLRSGLDMNLVLDVIGKGAAQSWQMDNRGKTMVEGKFDFGFAVDWMRKDLGLCLDEARR